MKRIIILIAAIFVFTACTSCSEDSEYAENRENIVDSGNDDIDTTNDLINSDYNILFVGNSLTDTNDLPKLVREKAKEKGVSIGTKMLAFPNYAIVDHWADGTVQTDIKSKLFDFVVIQQGPSSQQNGYDMLVYDGAKYAKLCSENETKLAYFMVWPSRAYYHTFDKVIANYTAGARENNAELCPVGQVWKVYFDETGDFSYYGSDQFHPSLKGSKVAAEVIVNTLFKL